MTSQFFISFILLLELFMLVVIIPCLRIEHSVPAYLTICNSPSCKSPLLSTKSAKRLSLIFNKNFSSKPAITAFQKHEMLTED